MNALRIIIAEDHYRVRRGMRQIVADEFPDAFIAEAENVASLKSQVFEKDWDLVISDFSMPGGNGLKALHQIRVQRPFLPVLMVSIYPEEQYAIPVLSAGASGYLNKDSISDKLTVAIKTILNGERYLIPGMEFPPHLSLSLKESFVFNCMMNGNGVDAALLHLTRDEIESIKVSVFQKLQLGTPAQLEAYVREHKLSKRNSYS